MKSLLKKSQRLKRVLKKLKWSVHFFSDGRVVLTNCRISLLFSMKRQFVRVVSFALTNIGRRNGLSQASWSAFCLSASYPDRRAREQVLYLCFSAASELFIATLHYFSEQLSMGFSRQTEDSMSDLIVMRNQYQ